MKGRLCQEGWCRRSMHRSDDLTCIVNYYVRSHIIVMSVLFRKGQSPGSPHFLDHVPKLSPTTWTPFPGSRRPRIQDQSHTVRPLHRSRDPGWAILPCIGETLWHRPRRFVQRRLRLCAARSFAPPRPVTMILLFA